jgi:hypothetical protein
MSARANRLHNYIWLFLLKQLLVSLSRLPQRMMDKITTESSDMTLSIAHIQEVFDTRLIIGSMVPIKIYIPSTQILLFYPDSSTFSLASNNLVNFLSTVIYFKQTANNSE